MEEEDSSCTELCCKSCSENPAEASLYVETGAGRGGWRCYLEAPAARFTPQIKMEDALKQLMMLWWP